MMKLNDEQEGKSFSKSYFSSLKTSFFSLHKISDFSILDFLSSPLYCYSCLLAFPCSLIVNSGLLMIFSHILDGFFIAAHSLLRPLFLGKVQGLLQTVWKNKSQS